jgi:hypothetical protein
VLGRTQQTKLDIILDATGGFLATFGYPDALHGAPTKIDGQLAWAGAPHEFDFPSLSGMFHLGVGPGRFTKIEPGAAGKLIGVLSLQALPRRVTLDFRDVFSEGFTFDEINGNVRIASGVMTTNNLKLAGPAAKVDIAGEHLRNGGCRYACSQRYRRSVSAGAALRCSSPILWWEVCRRRVAPRQAMMQDPIEDLQLRIHGYGAGRIRFTRNMAATASAAPHVPGELPVGITR